MSWIDRVCLRANLEQIHARDLKCILGRETPLITSDSLIMLLVCQEHQPARLKRNSFIFIISSLSLSVFLWMPGHPPCILRWTQVFISESSLANTTKLDANTQTCAHTPSLLLLTPVKAIVSDRRGGHAADVGMVMKCERGDFQDVHCNHTPHFRSLALMLN